MLGIRLVVGALAPLAFLVPAHAAWIHDTDANKIDDRIELVQREGVTRAYEDQDPDKRLVIAVFDGGLQRNPGVEYGVYVGYDHRPTEADLDELRSLGIDILKPYLYIDYVRTQATFEQIRSIARIPSVTRVEAIPMMYPRNHIGSRVVRARDSRGLKRAENYKLFPSARAELGLDGTGVVVAVLDTGVNDENDTINPLYPGHESLKGKFLGGGEFFSGNPLLNTGLNDSMNPEDHGSAASSYHATHVAGSAIGTGGEDGFFAGVAPAARLVDLKVLSDAGAGFGSADGVEWCIANRDNGWGLTGADTVYAGIDVLNLSLGGLDSSDGTDAGSQMINAAADSGLVCVIATGNDDSIDYITSPAAADFSVAVGATSHSGSLDRTDDQVTSFSNEGPRTDDLDLDHLDEMKPSVVAPGASIYSANGDPTTTGSAYASLSGTSMATPHVAGVVALIRQANPGLSAHEIRAILQNTAEHFIPSVKGDRPDDPYGVDPNYDPGCGWGLADVYAAAKEALNSTSGVQVVQIRADAEPDNELINFEWITQREFTFQGFHVHRADDVNGSPGPFVQLTTSLIAPTGSSAIEGVSNRTLYTYVDSDTLLELGNTYWYQVEWVDGGGGNLEPPVPVDYGELPAVATATFRIVHNTPDNDLSIRLGVSHGHAEDDPLFQVVGFTAGEADSVVVIEPANAATAALGYLEHYWTVPLSTGDGIEGWLPPGYTWSWFLEVSEGGYINRAGRITAFDMFVNDTPGSETGTLYSTDAILPAPTAETQKTIVWILQPAVGAPEIGLGAAGLFVRVAGANPFRDRTVIEYGVGAPARTAPGSLTIHDVLGRRVVTLDDRVDGSGSVVWDGRSSTGQPASPGVYFVRLDVGGEARSAKTVLMR